MIRDKKARELSKFALDKIHQDRLDLFKQETENTQIAVHSVLALSQATINNNKQLRELIEKYNITNIILMVILFLNVIGIGLYLFR